jgi:protein subunit release factor A
MKFKLTTQHLEEITSLRAQLADALANLDGNSSELGRLTTKKEELESVIQTLENSDSVSESTAAQLSTKRVQLEQIVKKIISLENIPAQVSAAIESQTLNLLRAFAKAATAATASGLENYRQEIAAKLRPYCSDDKYAWILAIQTPACASLAGVYTRRFGDFGFQLRELRQAIARADEILSGELAWSFDSKQK